MSENSTKEERTELPSERKMSKLRDEGTLFVSSEINHILVLIVGFIVLEKITAELINQGYRSLTLSFSRVAYVRIEEFNDIANEFSLHSRLFLPYLLILVGIVATTASLSTLLQTKFNIKKKKIHFRWNFLNPINGIRRIISYAGLLNIGKAILKLSLILPIGAYAVYGMLPEVMQLIHSNVRSTLHALANFSGIIFWRVIWLLVPIALFDFFYGRFKWLQTQKMTKNEVKDERKAIEGDEATKRKMIAKGLSRAMQRLTESVPKADVIITNPTHYAIALSYKQNSMSAPIVVAKGTGWIALRIREIAKESRIPIVERKSLARALYDSVDIDRPIPYELFRAVAEVLAYIYKIKGVGVN
jgi:flagellar biosynthesis protein FlhB